ncbi:stress response protein [Natronorubrum tibetense GA33]|uniref:Stress response protein n=2 Tax=Natronorubrum tibetense TaxID=63128 RepID=L9VL94_9EURY|nr:stress response protein [Natronorubrum tibetense GA33]
MSSPLIGPTILTVGRNAEQQATPRRSADNRLQFGTETRDAWTRHAGHDQPDRQRRQRAFEYRGPYSSRRNGGYWETDIPIGLYERGDIENATAERIGDRVGDNLALAYADSTGTNLVVMGPHGRTGLDERLLGSISERVLRTASVPVLTTNRRDDS